jgi:adenosylhomocysteinase
MDKIFENELAWVRKNMPRSARAFGDLPDLGDVRLACSLHIEIKMMPLFEALLARGAKMFVITCNPTTVRDEIVARLREMGAQVDAAFGMSEAAYARAIRNALAWQPTHLVEMGGDLTHAAHAEHTGATIRASLEGTGSGISRSSVLSLRYPVLNYDDLPIKEGLHNRHMVGLTTWQTFFDRTRLSLHGKRVLVIGYGSVGRGVADSARAFGGTVTIAERDPARAIEAAFAGWPVASVTDALPKSDVIVTATGAHAVIGANEFALLPDGAFLLNVGHRADEIDLAALAAFPREAILPYLDAVRIGQRTIYLFAGGSMANLTAGKGDSLNSFDVTLATLSAGIGYLVSEGHRPLPGVHLLPQTVWESFLL